MLGAMAEVTERVELGSLVICNAYRNPEYLADAHRTIDHISGGRAILGIGAGWFERDFDEYGYEFGTVGTRLTALEEALPRIEARLGKLKPPPLREHMPILIGGGGVKRTLKLTARHADIWHAFGDLDVFREKNAILDEHCAAEGRDPAAIERSWNGANGEWDAFREAGVTHFIIGITGSPSGYDLGPLRELVAVAGRAHDRDRREHRVRRAGGRAPARRDRGVDDDGHPEGQPAPEPVWFLWDGGDSVMMFSRESTRSSQPRGEPARLAQLRRRRARRRHRRARPGAPRSTVTARARIRSAPTSRSTPSTSRASGHTPESFGGTYSVPIRIELTRLRGH